jgi:hypothetical protein
MTKSTFSTFAPVSSALTVNRTQNASSAPMMAAQTAMDKMLVAGLQSGASFKATVSVTGANVTASFSIQDGPQQGHRPHTSRPAATDHAAAAHLLPIQSKTTPRTMTAAAGTSVPTACKYFAAGFCKRGQSCTFNHGSVQQPARAPQGSQPARASAAATAQVTQSHERPSTAGSRAQAAAGGGLVVESVQKFAKPIDARPLVAAQPPRQMQCSICMADGKSNEGVVCPKGDHFMHRACLDQWITSCCNEYLQAGPSKPSTVACPHNSRKCCVFTSNQLRRGGGGASASCIDLLNRVDVAEAALKKLPREEQLRRANQDAYMCPRCQFGPIAHHSCSDVSWQGNKCPNCSFHTDNISGWAKWNGKFQVAV